MVEDALFGQVGQTLDEVLLGLERELDEAIDLGGAMQLDLRIDESSHSRLIRHEIGRCGKISVVTENLGPDSPDPLVEHVELIIVFDGDVS